MLFSEVLGQPRSKQFLLQLNQSGRVPHALLFLGATGMGNLALATAFAQLMQCEKNSGSNQEEGGMFGEMERKPLEDSCGVCPACRKATAFAHPDIHFSFPTVGTNAVSTDFMKEWRLFLKDTPYADAQTWLRQLGADNKQGNINKEECNAIIKKLSLKAFEGRYKILLIWLPEYLGKEGNRLLKLIEEPPEDTLFLLVAENQEMILNTILSRCQLVKTDLLSDAEVMQALKTQYQVEHSRAEQISFMTAGNYGAAVEMAQNAENDDAALMLDWLRKCWRGNAIELVKSSEQLAALGRESQKQFLSYGLHFIRELMALVATGNANLRLGAAELSTAQNIAKVLNFEKLTQMATLFNDNIYYIERNANPKILFLDTSIGLHQVLKS